MVADMIKTEPTETQISSSILFEACVVSVTLHITSAISKGPIEKFKIIFLLTDNAVS